MARGVPTVKCQIANLSYTAVNGIGRSSTRRHLLRQLRELDSEIETLARAQNKEPWRILERAMWMQPRAAEIVWRGRLELHYLQSVREALIEALIRL
ncbi:MAG: hypothetical protein ACE5HA_02430 [Anaerolineae bacterium]